MDCEKFDRVVLDMLYDELDELTSAAAKRHMDQCSRCREAGTGLRATRDVGVLPLVDPPDDLFERILDAERKARARLPLRQRLGRGVSILAGYAMRPQLAMAATLLLMIGGSLLLLRTDPDAREAGRSAERGVPEAEDEHLAAPVAEQHARGESEAQAHGALPSRRERAEPERRAEAAAEEKAQDETSERSSVAAVDEDEASAADAGAGDRDYHAALATYRDGRYDEAMRRFDAIAEQGGSRAASASLLAAQASRINTGCTAATDRFERVSDRYPGSGAAHEATWQAADCYRVMGKMDLARRNYEALVAVSGYGERAKRALASLGAPSEAPVAARKAKAAKAAAPARPAAKPVAPPAADDPSDDAVGH